ncbi:MAG: YraN family protein [Selenomonadaceae bacterium]|nr:YraN family protein [Selenomonadaceae bacterium]
MRRQLGMGTPPKDGRKRLGRAGEDEAATFLKRKGYVLAARNYRVKVGEIDLIAWQDEKTLVFVEVKTRTGLQYGKPAEAVNYYKQRKIIRTAQWYLMEKHLQDCRCRFDVIEVYAMTDGAWQVRQIEGAFEA